MFSFKKLVAFLTQSFYQFVRSSFFETLIQLVITYYLLTLLDQLDVELLEAVIRLLQLLQAM